MDYLLAQADSTQVPSKIKQQDTHRGRAKERDGDTCACQSDTSLQRGTWLPMCSLTSSIRPRHCLNCSTSLSCRPDQTFCHTSKPTRHFHLGTVGLRTKASQFLPYLACTNIKHHKNQIRHHKNFLKTSYVVSLCSSNNMAKISPSEHLRGATIIYIVIPRTNPHPHQINLSYTTKETDEKKQESPQGQKPLMYLANFKCCY